MIRPRLRTFTLWTGTLLCVLIAAAFVVSGWWEIALQVPTSRGPAFFMSAGSALIVTDEWLSVSVSADSHSWGLSRWNKWTNTRYVNGVPPYFVTYLTFPIYAVFLAVAIPTLLVWRFWPKPVKPGHCRCGYDLHGNESGVCPECGVEVQT